MYTPETSCMTRNSVDIKNVWIKPLYNRKVRDFAVALRARKVSGAFEKRAPGLNQTRAVLEGGGRSHHCTIPALYCIISCSGMRYSCSVLVLHAEWIASTPEKVLNVFWLSLVIQKMGFSPVNSTRLAGFNTMVDSFVTLQTSLVTQNTTYTTR